MSCPKCGMPLIVANGQEACGRCDTKRGAPKEEWDTQGPSVMLDPLAPIDRELAQRTDQAALELAKVATVETVSEIRELVGVAKAKRLAGMVRDPTKEARNLAAVFNALIEKSLLLEGRPTQITEHRDLEDYAKILQQLAPQAVKVIDSTAEDVGSS